MQIKCTIIIYTIVLKNDCINGKRKKYLITKISNCIKIFIQIIKKNDCINGKRKNYNNNILKWLHKFVLYTL